MASAAVDTAQTETAYQKQDAIFVGRKKVAGQKVNAKKNRWFKDIGLGFKTPAEAKEVSMGTGTQRKTRARVRQSAGF